MPLRRIRHDYRGGALLEARAPREPFALLRRWILAASRTANREPGAMTLATIDAHGRPRARMVLLKDASPAGLTFYTNLGSAKARELLARPDAACVLWWPELSRQVRIEGRVTTVSRSQSDAYFATR